MKSLMTSIKNLSRALYGCTEPAEHQLSADESSWTAAALASPQRLALGFSNSAESVRASVALATTALKAGQGVVFVDARTDFEVAAKLRDALLARDPGANLNLLCPAPEYGIHPGTPCSINVLLGASPAAVEQQLRAMFSSLCPKDWDRYEELERVVPALQHIITTIGGAGMQLDAKEFVSFLATAPTAKQVLTFIPQHPVLAGLVEEFVAEFLPVTVDASPETEATPVRRLLTRASTFLSGRAAGSTFAASPTADINELVFSGGCLYAAMPTMAKDAHALTMGRGLLVAITDAFQRQAERGTAGTEVHLPVVVLFEPGSYTGEITERLHEAADRIGVKVVTISLP